MKEPGHSRFPNEAKHVPNGSHHLYNTTDYVGKVLK